MSASFETGIVRVGWGAGMIAQGLLPSEPEAYHYLVDSDERKWGQSLAGVTICSPDKLLQEDPACLQLKIFSSSWAQICEQLLQMGFSEAFVRDQVEKPQTASSPEFLSNLQRLQQDCLKNVEVSSFPLNLNFDITNICNLRCPLCPTGQNDKRYPRGQMAFADFKKIMDEVGVYASDIYLFNWGEAFLNQDVFRMIAYARENFSCRVTISSNFNTITATQIDQLAASSLDFLSLSIDGASQESYSRYRVGGDLAQVLRNIDLLQQRKQAMGNRLPVIEWRYLVNAYNDSAEEIALARKMAEDRGLIFNLGMIHVDMGKEIEEGLEKQLQQDGHWISRNHSDTYCAYDFNHFERKEKKAECTIPWRIAYINWNGDLAPCCGLYDPKYTLGNVLTDSFARVWNGEKIQLARKILIDPETVAHSQHICARCRRGGFIV